MQYRIGTRGSKLALVQSEYVKTRLQEAYPQDQFELQIIKTKGDLVTDRPLGEIGGSGLFVKEIEKALLAGEIQLAVHSMKDMPCRLPEGLVFAPVWKREDPRDVLVLREKQSLEELPQGAVIGTGSKRRAFQLLKLRPDLRIVGIRGNVDTRIRKMQEQKLDGIVLAAAGMKRLGLKGKVSQYLEPEQMIPAPTQGTLAIELCGSNQELFEKLSVFRDSDTALGTEAERCFLREMGADCHLPIGAFAAVCRDGENGLEDNNGVCQPELRLDVIYGNEDGTRLAAAHVRGAEPETLAKRAAFEIRKQLAGKVTLVGAGPGDPELLTRKGEAALRTADCCIYDRLVSPELLTLVPKDCEMIYVGKENHHHTLKQEEINALLVEKAMVHRQVVRLKGGDPYVFGRGGEEALYLLEHGVTCEVVPGISSALAGLAYAGIPITHRGLAAGFHVVTAHSKRDALAEIDFSSMVHPQYTCVFLMGLSVIDELCKKLTEAGKDPRTPAAVISHATSPQQRCCVGVLSDIAEKTREAGLTSPALIVVGEAVKLQEQLSGHTMRKDFGRQYLVAVTEGIGPKQRYHKLLELLRRDGADVRPVVTGRIEVILQDISEERIRRADWLLFSSRNGVQGFFQNLLASGADLRAMGKTKVAAIGTGTAQELRNYGIRADFVPKQQDSEGFCRELAPKLRPEDHVIYIQNEGKRHPVTEGLAGVCRLEELPVYRNAAEDPVILAAVTDEALLASDRIYFTNALSILRLLGDRDREVLRKLDEKGSVYVIGPACRRKLEELGISHIHMAEHADYDSLAAEPVTVHTAPETRTCTRQACL